MSLNLFLSIVALASAALLAARDRESRVPALVAAFVTALVVLMQLDVLSIRVDYVHLIAWGTVAAAGVFLFLRQTGRNGGALSALLILAAAIPIAKSLGLIA